MCCVIMKDQLRRDTLGCYGNNIVQTPHIDALANFSVQFEKAHTPSPICVPARASIATGQYVHQNRCWDNAIPNHVQIDIWHHRLLNAGWPSTTIGNLHFRGTADDNGFTKEIQPLHVAATDKHKSQVSEIVKKLIMRDLILRKEGVLICSV